MNRFLILFTSTILLLLVFVKQGMAIHCYICNSAYHKDCADPFSSETVAYINCTERSTKATNATSSLCRKIVQKVDSEYRYIRDCGFIDDGDDRSCINRAGTYHISMKYCECHGDGCNGVEHQITSSMPAIISATFLMIFTSLM